MTPDQLFAIRARLDAANTHAMSTQIEVDRDGTTRWINLGPFLCSSHDDAYRVRCLVTLMHHAPTDLRALLDEVERLTTELHASQAEVAGLHTDPLPAAAWVREVQQAAFRRGAEAMREASAQKIERDCGNAQTVANWIRDLPIPEGK